MNVVRILSVAVALHHYGVDLSTGWQHDLLGYVCLGLAATLLLSADRLLRVVFYPARDQETVRQLPNPLVAIWNNVFRLPDSPFAAPTESPRPTESRSPIKSAAFITCTCIAIAGLALQGFRLLQNQPTTSTSTAVAAEPFHNFPEQLPADVISRFTQIKHEQVRGNINMPMGEIGDIWSGVIEGVPVAVAVNQPYADWHDLNACYRGTGWTLNERRTVETKVDGQDWYCVESNWILPNQSYAHVWFSAFTEDGQPVNPVDLSLIGRWKATLNRDKRELIASDGKKVAMVQLVVEHNGLLPRDTLNELLQAHLQSREFYASRQPKNRQQMDH